MVGAQKQHGKGSANAGKVGFIQTVALWAEVPAVLVHSVWVHEGEINPQLWVAEYIFSYPKRFQKGDKSYHLCHGPEHRYLRTHYWNFQVWPFWTLKLRELLLDNPRIFSLASDVGMPILGQGQATGTWECSGHISSQRWRHGDKYTEWKPVSVAHLKWTGFHFYKSQNKVKKQILICFMSLKELLEKLQHWAESTPGCSV